MEQEVKQFIDLKFETVNVKLDGISNHLKNLNGSVARHEKEINSALQWRERKYAEVDQKHEEVDEMIREADVDGDGQSFVVLFHFLFLAF